MSFRRLGTVAAERLALPDALLRRAIAGRVAQTNARLLHAPAGADAAFATAMRGASLARHTDAANAQHYELPPAFFARVLGTHRKYSCCLYGDGAETLDAAEARALEETAAHAQLADGQSILELGCGWGSLSLWMAARYPAARILAVSNSAAQRATVLGLARERGLANLDVLTADMVTFDTARCFDRIVSVEMFEHMANWPALLGRLRGWLAPDGRAFVHVFAHARTPYWFEHEGGGDWIARHFFTGGVMPSHSLMRHCADGLFEIEAEWRWSGAHYRRTAEDWLARCDAQADEVRAILRDAYGAEAGVWFRRWRLFFLATAGLFGHDGGAAWGVSHYLLRPIEAATAAPSSAAQ